MLDLSKSTYVRYIEDFRFWTDVAGRVHHLPDKELFCREAMYYRTFTT